MDKFLARVAAHFNLENSFYPLGGECDLNFSSRDGQGAVIVKIMRAGCELSFVEMQSAAITHALKQDSGLPLPKMIGQPIILPDSKEEKRVIWLQRTLEGKPMGDIAPQSPELLCQLGGMAGRLNKALRDFDHPQLSRKNKWQLLDSGWIEAGFEKIKSPHRRALLQKIFKKYQQILPQLQAMPHQAIHNDLNDWNILIEQKLNQKPRVSGLIDFGDMCRAPVICDLAIAGAYAIMRQSDGEQALAALAQGFHEACPLPEDALALLWPLVQMRLAVSVVNAAIESEKSPDELYVTISERGAWDLLENENFDEVRLLARLRHVSGLSVTSQISAVTAWLAENRGQFSPVLGGELDSYSVADLSVEKCLWPENPFDPRPLQSLDEVDIKGELALGRYGEPRLAYHHDASAAHAATIGRPTVSLGIDIFAPADSLVYAPLDGVVVETVQSESGLNVILRHDIREQFPESGNRFSARNCDTDKRRERLTSPSEGEAALAGSFFTRWSHLAVNGKKLETGTKIAAGEAFAVIANISQNGGWLPHLFLQMSFVELEACAWWHASSPDDQNFSQALFPNPAILLGLDAGKVTFTPPSDAALLGFRQSHFSANLKLSYREPVTFVRGWQHHLFDPWGRPFLDSYNNVPHVGHAHPRIRKVACAQLARMNSNTRYLHPAQKAFAEKLIGKMPVDSGLEVCFFVNSGSEANELALRLARAATGGYDMITPDHGYHGNTTGAIDISAYKFNKPGMERRKEWVHLVDVADDYRGRFRAENQNCAMLYAAQIDEALAAIDKRGGKLAGFICETFPSVGGQIIPPLGYLAQVYARIRAAGGICIADEVQTGLGRLGDYYFAFEQQNVVPDIVVLGKPIGNGHPLAALVTTRAIAEKFEQGAEYFSTFGGSTLSCLMGREVLDIVDDEGLQAKAQKMGARLLARLRQLQMRHQAIGEVRGMGLFIGVDLVEDRESRIPATALAEHVTNSLRQRHILIGREGPADNILKIRPPLTIDTASIDRICSTLDEILYAVSV